MQSGKNLIFLLLFLLVAAGAAIFIAYSGEQNVKNVEMLQSGKNIAVVTSAPVYSEGVRGYLAKPASGGPFPGVIMIHEFWGLNENIKMMAEELAKEGYAVLAVDLFEGEVAADQERARVLSSGINQERATANLRTAAKYLRETEQVPKLATLGWCFGGGQSLQLALSGELLDATVIYYGRLISDEVKLMNIRWPVLGIFGDQDQSISVQSVKDFEQALGEVGVTREIYIYPGVGHAFANPTGMNYAPEETKDAWTKTTAFLARNLK